MKLTVRPLVSFRAVAILAFVLLVWLAMMWVVWCLPWQKTLPSGTTVTRFGPAGWKQVRDPPAGMAYVLPFSSGRTRPLGLIVSIVMSAAGTLVIVAWMPRDMADELPLRYVPSKRQTGRPLDYNRGRCVKCGYPVGQSMSDRCPECGSPWPGRRGRLRKL